MTDSQLIESVDLPYGLRRRLMAVIFGIIATFVVLNAFNLLWVGLYYQELAQQITRQAHVNNAISVNRLRSEALFNYSRSGNREYLDVNRAEYRKAMEAITNDPPADIKPVIRYRIRDIGQMLKTLDETEQRMIQEAESGLSSIYLQNRGDEAVRLSGYIIQELQLLSEIYFDEMEVFYKGFSSRMRRTLLLSFILLWAMVAVALFVARRFVLSVSRPVHNLAIRMVRFGNGDLETRGGEIGGRDEIAVLGRSFDQMAERIRRYIRSMRDQADLELRLNEQELARQEAERLLKEAELARLYAQINPHFLFNTLNILGSLTLVENAPRAKDVVADLSDLLRYSLRTGMGMVKLEHEIAILRSYMNIQKYRFDGKISWRESIDEAALSAEIPGMVLQPLVENAVKHGLEPIERSGCITLSVEILDSDVVVVVSDDGIGISDKALSLINDESTRTESLGIRNVSRRLSLYYGRSVLKICRLRFGTECRIQIPFR